MRIECSCCGRQIVNYKCSNKYCVGGKDPTKLWGNTYSCHECAREVIVESGIEQEDWMWK